MICNHFHVLRWTILSLVRKPQYTFEIHLSEPEYFVLLIQRITMCCCTLPYVRTNVHAHYRWRISGENSFVPTYTICIITIHTVHLVMLPKCSSKSAHKIYISAILVSTHLRAHKTILFSLFPDFIIVFHLRNWVGNGILTYSHRVLFCARSPLSVFLAQQQTATKYDNNRLATSKEDLIKNFLFNQPIKTFEIFCEYKMLDLICKRFFFLCCEV